MTAASYECTSCSCARTTCKVCKSSPTHPERSQSNAELLWLWCSAAYIVALLHDGFKLGMHERRLRFTNYVEDSRGNSMDIDWTLGRSMPASSFFSFLSSALFFFPSFSFFSSCLFFPFSLSMFASSCHLAPFLFILKSSSVCLCQPGEKAFMSHTLKIR